MERLCQSSEMAGLIPPVDLDSRVVYFPIRHHSPACAWHVDRLIRAWQPDAVLIEGPRDATALAPLLLHEETALPVAIFTTYIKRLKDQPEHYAAYYPLCDYSPEYAAIKAAAEVGAKAKFIDLTFPEQIACRQWPDGKVQSLLDESYLRHSRFLQAACQRAGVRDACRPRDGSLTARPMVSTNIPPWPVPLGSTTSRPLSLNSLMDAAPGPNRAISPARAAWRGECCQAAPSN
jgi:hypothetical protein